MREYILCAAIWYKELELKKIFTNSVLPINLDKGIVFCGHRHAQAMYSMCSITGLRSVTNATDGAGEHIQGFLTSQNRFVDRNEAGIIAHREGQTEKLKETLFSEDLY